MFKGLSDLANLMKNAGAIQGRMQELQQRLQNVRIEGSAGGGLVVVQVNGQQQLLSCEIDPRVTSSGDRAMLQQLIVAAVNEAQNKARQLLADEMGKLGGDVPGMSDMLQRLSGNSGG